MRERTPMRLQTKLLFGMIFLVILSIGLSSYFISEFEVDRLEMKIEANLRNVGHIIAENQDIQWNLNYKKTEEVQVIVERYLDILEDIEIITIADMDGLRYGHPSRDRLGKYFVGGDEKQVLETGSIYSSIATGTLGRSIRVFIPIYFQNNQVGFVMTAQKYDRVEESILNIRRSVLVYSFFGILIGGVGAILISTSIKKSLLNLEPYQIAKLYREKDVILKSTREGILAIDAKCSINLMNDSAKKILNCEGKDFIGVDIESVFPTTKLPRILETGIAEYDREQLINGAQILTNRIPIYENGRLVGALATFKDLSDVVTLAEEMTGIKQVVRALRATTHEFKNKLHLINGLLELDEIDEAKKYVMGLGYRYTKIQDIVSGKIKNATINALIIGKINRASEDKIDIEVTSDSLLLCEGYKINSGAMVIIIGNLIENAIEAIQKTNRDDGKIIFYINDTSENLVIEVSDNGIGIEQKYIETIFNRGFTTKRGSNGIGLDLVKSNVERLKGEIEVMSEKDKGTTFTIVIPIEDNN
ncbi:MAG: sensor histidine kinase [Tissierellales bacterium]|jgi:two-component system CitB family sensor kinase/two-component system sensor histidine kinase DctS|nr:sensor histidine kinase [Tissierellales bacterium]